MDDMSRITMDINGEDFASSEYDIFISDSANDLKIRQTIEQLAHAYVQNGGSLTLPIKVLRSDSITQMGKIIEEQEAENNKRSQEMEQQKLKSQEAAQQAALEDKQKDRDLEYYKINKEAETKLEIAGQSPQEDTSLDEAKLGLDAQKQANEQSNKEKEFNIKQSKLEEDKRHNMATEKISKTKIKK